MPASLTTLERYCDAKRREDLILEHLPQVRLIAKRIQKGLPASVSLDDLISSGVVGLIAAVDRYDPGQKVQLKTYAEHKIRGAILDSLRVLDWAPREKRKRAKLIESAVTALEGTLGRIPNEEEIASQLGIPTAEYRDWLSEARALTLGSLESSRAEEDGRGLLNFISGSSEEWPSQQFERAELGRLLLKSLESMPSIEQSVLRLYFFEEMTLRDIANKFDLHESRISQLKTQAISRLRTHLEACWPLDRGEGQSAVEAAHR